MFGRSYTQIGSNTSDFLIKTRGQVKIQWGTKFIDLIKDGKINVESTFIFEVNDQASIGTKNGIYVIGNKSVYLKIGETLLELIGEQATTYVSFLAEQITTSEQKQRALKNLGFIYDSLEDVSPDMLQNGIVYISSEQKLFTINDGKLQEFSVDFPNPLTSQFVISKNDSNKGSLVIHGSGINNSLAFDSLLLYVEDETSYIESLGEIYISVNDDKKLIIGNKADFKIPITVSEIESPDSTDISGFKLAAGIEGSYLEIDDLILRNRDLNAKIYPQYWYNKSNIIKNISRIKDYEDSNNQEFQIDLLYENQYQIGDSLVTYVSVQAEKKASKQIEIPLTIVSLKTECSNTVYGTAPKNIFEGLTVNLTNALNSLKGQVIFLTKPKESSDIILTRSKDGIDIVEPTNTEQENNFQQVQTRLGNLTILGLEEENEMPIGGSGIYSKQGYFKKVGYVKGYTPPMEDNSSNLASTEWIRKYLSLEGIIPGVIMGYRGDSKPDGWEYCDGQNGTPDLTKYFIKVDSLDKEINSSKYSLVFIMKVK